MSSYGPDSAGLALQQVGGSLEVGPRRDANVVAKVSRDPNMPRPSQSVHQLALGRFTLPTCSPAGVSTVSGVHGAGMLDVVALTVVETGFAAPAIAPSPSLPKLARSPARVLNRAGTGGM